MKVLFSILFFIAALSFVKSQELPRNITKEEKKILNNYVPPVSENRVATPPTFEPRVMAEWEELQGLMITWRSFTDILAQIVDYAQEETKVFIITTDSNSVKNTLNSFNVPLYNIVFVYAGSNSIWSRDYGAWSIYENNTENHSFVDWIYNRPRPLDDLVPEELAQFLNIDIYSTTQSPYNLTNTGGNFMTDGHGTGFASKLVLQENSSKTEQQINDIMYQFMGLTRYIKMNTLPYDEIHHIDMHMKLLDEETLLVGEYPQGVADGPMIEANLQYILDNYKTCFNRDYKVVRIPMPPDAFGRYPNNGGDYRTYTNSVIVNKTVIVPTYEVQYDTTALRIYREAMPGYNIVGIDCNDIIPSLGAIHCITKEVGHSDPIFISHAKITNEDIQANTPIIFSAFLSTPSGISEANLFYTTDTSLGYSALTMNKTIGDTFSAQLAGFSEGTSIYYYIEAISNSGRTIAKPLTAPLGFNKFIIPAEKITSTLTVEQNWNLISLPLIADDMSVNSVFPNASSSAFKYDISYQIEDYFEPGLGYWIKFPLSEIIEITGVIPQGSIELKEYWNLVGPFNQNIPVDQVSTIPENIIISDFFGFNGAYISSDTLFSGKGYWVKTSEAGNMYLLGGGSVKKVYSNFTADEIILKNIEGNSVTLYLSSNVLTKELPPLPPIDVFDARFSNNNYVESENSLPLSIKLQGKFPVELTMDFSKYSVSYSKNGEVIFDGKKIIVKDRLSTPLIINKIPKPEQFTLSQNYPNPFNPSTTISFELPENSYVRLEVFNVLGESVKLLVNDFKYSGNYEVIFNSFDLSSGIYFYKFSAEGISGKQFNSSRKMLLVK